MRLPRQLEFLSLPDRFMAVSAWLAPTIGALAVLLLEFGLWFGFKVPPDYQQGATVLIMFIHVPAAWLSMFGYVCLAVSSFLSLVFRHALADAAAKACAPLGAGFTALALATGSLWGRPMWGAWWVWDARLTSVLVLLLFYLGYIALRASIEDEAKASVESEFQTFEAYDAFQSLRQRAAHLAADAANKAEFEVAKNELNARYGFNFDAHYVLQVRKGALYATVAA